MNLPELQQATAAARRSEWSRSRCVEWLRFEAARLNVELVQIAEKTKSEAVKVAVIDAIYGAILSGYPHLKTEAADAAVRQKLKLAKNGRKTSAAVKAAEPEAPAATSSNIDVISSKEAPKATLAQAKQDAEADGEADMVQLANVQLSAIRIVHGYLVPTAAKEGFVIDALQANGLIQNMLIQSYYQRTHRKFSRTKIEGPK
jgi:hypothetical protein